MAKLKGILKIEGTLGDITFYKGKDGDYVAKTKSGVSKKQIEKDPAFARTRENGSEFGSVAHSGKLIRLGSSVLINKAKESTLNNRLVQILTKVKNLDVVPIRGSRQVAVGLATAEGKAFLKGYDFTANRFWEPCCAVHMCWILPQEVFLLLILCLWTWCKIL